MPLEAGLRLRQRAHGAALYALPSWRRLRHRQRRDQIGQCPSVLHNGDRVVVCLSSANQLRDLGLISGRSSFHCLQCLSGGRSQLLSRRGRILC